MLFNSYIFILYFLPLTLGLYFTLGRFGKRTLQKVVLVIASLIFYGYFNPWYLFIICGSVVVNYGFAQVLLKQYYAPPAEL